MQAKKGWVEVGTLVQTGLKPQLRAVFVLFSVRTVGRAAVTAMHAFAASFLKLLPAIFAREVSDKNLMFSQLGFVYVSFESEKFLIR